MSQAGTFAFAEVKERDSVWSGKGDGLEDQSADKLPKGQREVTQLFFFFHTCHGLIKESM